MLLSIKYTWGAGPHGRVVNFVRSASVSQGLLVQILGTDLHTTHQAMLWQHPTEKSQNDLQVGYTTMYWDFGERKKKRGRLAADVSSGPIFLAKKLKRKEMSGSPISSLLLTMPPSASLHQPHAWRGHADCCVLYQERRKRKS